MTKRKHPKTAHQQAIAFEDEVEQELTLGERASDALAEFAGSWVFIGSFLLAMFCWIGLNVWALGSKPFDPYPFILLNLVLSCVAALQAPIIMMSQNRMETKDRIRSINDFSINLKAEAEIQELHTKLDLISARLDQLLPPAHPTLE